MLFMFWLMDYLAQQWLHCPVQFYPIPFSGIQGPLRFCSDFSQPKRNSHLTKIFHTLTVQENITLALFLPIFLNQKQLTSNKNLSHINHARQKLPLLFFFLLTFLNQKQLTRKKFKVMQKISFKVKIESPSYIVNKGIESSNIDMIIYRYKGSLSNSIWLV